MSVVQSSTVGAQRPLGVDQSSGAAAPPVAPLAPSAIPARSIDLTGLRFGQLVVLGFAGRSGTRGRPAWLCQCDCGATSVVRTDHLRSGHVSACSDQRRHREPVHGHCTREQMSPTYYSWRGMVGRCTQPTHSAYHQYGARGVTVCDRWLSFENFLADMGERPEGTQLHRRNNSRGYEPGNCEWLEASEHLALHARARKRVAGRFAAEGRTNLPSLEVGLGNGRPGWEALARPSTLTCLRPLCDAPAAPGWRQLCEPHLEQQLDAEAEWRDSEDDR